MHHSVSHSYQFICPPNYWSAGCLPCHIAHSGHFLFHLWFVHFSDDSFLNFDYVCLDVPFQLFIWILVNLIIHSWTIGKPTLKMTNQILPQDSNHWQYHHNEIKWLCCKPVKFSLVQDQNHQQQHRNQNTIIIIRIIFAESKPMMIQISRRTKS